MNDIDDDVDDDSVFPTVCEKNIVVLKQIGTPDILLYKNEAICIVSQNRSTVMVQRQQILDSPNPPRLLRIMILWK